MTQLQKLELALVAVAVVLAVVGAFVWQFYFPTVGAPFITP